MATRDEYRALAEAGLTAAEAAERLGVNRFAPYQAARAGGFKFAPAAPKPRAGPRRADARRADAARSSSAIEATIRAALTVWRERLDEATEEVFRLEAMLALLPDAEGPE
jgi:hypothetical protein